ncbi:hypothetical protein F0562_032149 [Nyssa sinensis]|uniref:Uncharacterized protein n=1 Tax=Nyssa sinensis TaxID=561372 RepID=A0A5J5AXU1_9ASTE|nr:hypothetical protein F0562_032149 [Nyssa sinensis]
MLYNQTFNLDQVAFAAEGIKDAQQTMSALKTANKELKGMMKTVKIEDIDNMQDEMMDLMDVSNEIQESLGRSYSVPDDIDEEELMGELDALEADMGMETEGDGVPAYLQPDKDSDLDSELNLPSAPTGHAAVPAGRSNGKAEDELGLPAVPHASIREGRKSLFRFDARWVHNTQCETAIQRAWDFNVNGTRWYKIHCKLKQCRRNLLEWCRRSNHNSALNIRKLKEEIKDLKEDAVYDSEKIQCLDLQLNREWQLEEDFWRQNPEFNG